MPISFLAPIFLAGLAAIAVPVLIHLTNRPKRDVTPFPSLMFLEPAEVRESSRRRLRNLFLLALRVLALILIAGAFSRPFLDRPDAPPVTIDGGRELVILLDRSASMAIGDRMPRAVSAAAEAATGLQRGDRATLVLFDHRAMATGRATDQPAVLRAALDTVRAGDGSTELAPALRLAESILAGSPLPRRELLILSDFQRRSWDPASGVRMPPGTRIRTMAVGAPVASRGVADVSFTRERFSGRERARISARIVDRSAAAGAGGALGSAEALRVDLVVDDRVLQSREVRAGAGETAVATFDPLTLEAARSRGEIRVPGDAFPADDTFRFTLSADRALRVLVLEPRPADPRASLYLSRALELGGDHEVGVRPADRFGASDLAGIDVVVLNDVGSLDEEARGRLTAFVRAGGGLVAVVGERARESVLGELLPGTLEGTRDRTAAGGGSLARLDLQHPVFEPFRDPGAGGLAAARFYRYRELTPTANASVPARFDDGVAAIVDRPLGRGRVLALNAPLDGRWSDLVLQPSFLPLAHRLIAHAAAREPEPAWRTVGDLWAAGGARDGAGGADANGGDRGDRAVVLTPGGARVEPETSRGLVRLDEAGFYELRDPRSTTPPPVVAVNLDPAEMEMAVVPPDEVRAAIAPEGPAPSLASVAPQDRERRQALWWFFLAGAFVLLVAESIVGNRLSQRAGSRRSIERRRA